MEGWLCPALFRYFPSAPREIYVKVEPLKSFQPCNKSPSLQLFSHQTLRDLTFQPGSGAQVKSDRSTNGHFYSKLFSEVRTLDWLTHYEAPRHTKRTEGRTEQHHGRSTIGDIALRAFASETGSECAV